MTVFRKIANNLVVALIGPIHVARDNQVLNSGLLASPLRQFTRMLNFSYRKTLQTSAGFQLSPYGVWLKVRQDDTFTYCMRGEYGYRYAQHLRRIDKPFTFLDIGANIGLYSLIALENSNLQTVHSFDPDSDSIGYLQANLEHAQSKKWTLHPVAVSTSSGQMTLNKKRGHSGASTLEHPTFESEAQETINVVNHEYLNANINSNGTNIVVKIDVEGHELSVLTALAKSNLMSDITEIFAEFDAEMSNTQLTEDWFDSHGFRKAFHIGDNSHWDALYVKTSNKE